MEKLNWSELGPPDLNRINQNRRDTRRVRLQPCNRKWLAIGQHHNVVYHLLWNSRRHGSRFRIEMAAHITRQDPVEIAVVSALEHHDTIASRKSSSDSDRGHHRLGPRGAKRRAVHSCDFAE